MTDDTGTAGGAPRRRRPRAVWAAVAALALVLHPLGAGATRLYYDGGRHHPKPGQPAQPLPTPVKWLSATDLVDVPNSVDSHGCMSGQVGVPLNFALALAQPGPKGTTYAFSSGSYGEQQPPVPHISMSSDGLVTGAPYKAGAGAFGFAAVGPEGSGYFVLGSQCYQIGEPDGASSAIAIDKTYPASADVGVFLDLNVPNVTGVVGRVAWSVSPPPPAGLHFVEGRVFGVPTAAGEWDYAITVVDSTGASASTGPSSLKVLAASRFPSLSTDGTCIDTTRQVPVHWNGWTWDPSPSGAVSWTGILPPGLSIDPHDGTITGTPTDNPANVAGTSSGFVTAEWTDSDGVHDAYASPCFDPNAPKPLRVGQGADVVYDVNEAVEQLGPTVEGGSGEVTWSVYPTLPEGLTLGDDGSITGSLAYPMSLYYTLTAKDASGSSAVAVGSITVLDDAPRVAYDGTCISADAGGGPAPAFPWVVHNPQGRPLAWKVSSATPRNGVAAPDFSTLATIDPATGLVTAQVPASAGSTPYDYNVVVDVSWVDDQGASSDYSVNACARFNHAPTSN